MKSLKYYLHKAHREKWAIGQFNFSTFEQLQGIVRAAEKLRSPIIIGTSEGESRFVNLQEAVAVRDVLRKKTSLPIFLNLDHGKSFLYLKEAMKAGYDMVHFDGSKLALAENIKISKQVASFAQWRGVVVEGEVGRISTDSSKVYPEKFAAQEGDLTKVAEAKEYIQKTKMNCLAISVGTFHGIQASGASPHLRLDRLREINTVIKVPLVLHGGSGTPAGDIKKAIRLGICKININTDMRVAFTDALRKNLQSDKNEIVPYKYFAEPIQAVEEVVEKYIKLFGSANRI